MIKNMKVNTAADKNGSNRFNFNLWQRGAKCTYAPSVKYLRGQFPSPPPDYAFAYNISRVMHIII